MTRQHPIRIFAALLALGLVSGPRLRANEPPKAAAEAKTPGLSVDPRAAPSPAFRYRLMPLDSERTPGDAAPIYLRLIYDMPSDSLRMLDQQATDWLNIPLNQFPAAEAASTLKTWSSHLQQLDFGARRRTCDWNYTIPEQRTEILEITLPDAQGMRRWARLLALKTRSEVAAGRFENAARTLETHLSFSRHVAEAPFTITWLVGVASARMALDRLEELIGQPGAPNFYWALTSLPRPLVPFRHAAETEQAMGTWLVPELADLDRPRSPAEWASRLASIHARLSAIDAQIFFTGENGVAHTEPKMPELARFKASLLPEAVKSARERIDRANPSNDDEAVARYVAERYREIRDSILKLAYLPYAEGIPYYEEASKAAKVAESGPLRPLALLLPGVQACLLAEARIDQRVAALRVIEALRLHAAKSGKLPRTLGEVTDVPIPPDPITGKPFEYRLDGDAAVLPAPAGLPANSAATYRITLRR